ARLHETGPRCPSGASQKSVAAAFAVVQAGTLPLLQPVSASSWPVCEPNRAGEDTPGTGNLSCEAYTKRATRSGRAGPPGDVSARCFVTRWCGASVREKTACNGVYSPEHPSTR